MKNEPNETDREAARLFTLCEGMRAMTAYSSDGFGRVVSVNGSKIKQAFTVGPTRVSIQATELGLVGVQAVDTEDPASLGCMLAEVEAAYAKDLHVVWIRFPAEGDAGWVVQPADWSMSLDGIGFGPTRGSALVAAMKMLKGAT